MLFYMNRHLGVFYPCQQQFILSMFLGWFAKSDQALSTGIQGKTAFSTQMAPQEI